MVRHNKNLKKKKKMGSRSLTEISHTGTIDIRACTDVINFTETTYRNNPYMLELQAGFGKLPLKSEIKELRRLHEQITVCFCQLKAPHSTSQVSGSRRLVYDTVQLLLIRFKDIYGFQIRNHAPWIVYITEMWYLTSQGLKQPANVLQFGTWNIYDKIVLYMMRFRMACISNKNIQVLSKTIWILAMTRWWRHGMEILYTLINGP